MHPGGPDPGSGEPGLRRQTISLAGRYTGHLMARSRRKTPISGYTTSESEKADKAEAHRRIRREVGEVLHKDPGAELLPHERELSDPWDMGKDGKGRFDPLAFPKL